MVLKEPQTLSTLEAANHAGKARSTITRWIREGKLSATRDEQGDYDININDLQKLILEDGEELARFRQRAPNELAAVAAPVSHHQTDKNTNPSDLIPKNLLADSLEIATKEVKNLQEQIKQLKKRDLDQSEKMLAQQELNKKELAKRIEDNKSLKERAVKNEKDLNQEVEIVRARNKALKTSLTSTVKYAEDLESHTSSISKMSWLDRMLGFKKKVKPGFEAADLTEATLLITDQSKI